MSPQDLLPASSVILDSLCDGGIDAAQRTLQVVSAGYPARPLQVDKLREDPLMRTAAQAYEQSKQKQRLFSDVSYAAQTRGRPRRTVGKAEHSAQGENPRFVVTNLEGDGQDLYERLYCARGEMENRITKKPLGLFAARTSCHDFAANQFRVLLSAAAYVLIQHVRRVGLTGTDLTRARVGTIRLKLLKIGARLVQSVRRVMLHPAGGYPLKQPFEQVISRLTSVVPAG